MDDGTDAMLEISSLVPGKLRELGPDRGTQNELGTLVRLDDFPRPGKPLDSTWEIGTLPLRYESSPGRSNVPRNAAQRNAAIEQSSGIRSFWDDERGFLVHGRGEDSRQLVLDMAAAYEGGRLVLTTGMPGAFGVNGGLCLLDEARIPQRVRDEVLAMDEAHLEIRAAVAECGIEETLRAAGRGWHALSPQWVRDPEGHYGIPVEELSGGDRLVFFLNPADQQRHNYGWMTFRDLQDWAQGKGQVIKSVQTEERKGHTQDALTRLRRQLDPEGMTVLERAAEASGVPALVREGALEVLTMVPHWAGEPGGDVVFWVNPRSQDIRRLGWFTPEEVLAMACGEGPGMRSADEVATLKDLWDVDKKAHWELKMAPRPREAAMQPGLPAFAR